LYFGNLSLREFLLLPITVVGRFFVAVVSVAVGIGERAVADTSIGHFQGVAALSRTEER